ncbi:MULTISPECIES: hypothetical protein [unclassified Corynebacterium]|uniref:hypothetical protein n=1 Tax=unclassified Corynebacterium TaxID=2624378 RepID=UPI00211B9E99|nr:MULTISPECIES: hypothetical protein [unclassified Corynebacterium]MCQ9359268.1 hypothetical protein [Corynebacterium sp. 142RC1]MCQ9365409.1 hypothetical protein [Corynebacterium sp. 70RC1]
MHSDLTELLATLSSRQLRHVRNLVLALSEGTQFETNANSDFVDDEFAASFGDQLIAHNQGSGIPLTKDKFEWAMVQALQDSGHQASKLPNGNPGEDVLVDGVPWSLKTQADKNIKIDRIHISKYMELGKGAWLNAADIEALRQRMFDHMSRYERIFTLRCFPRVTAPTGGTTYTYELVEIPKALLLLAANWPIEIMEKSRQSPKPAYCHVFDQSGDPLYSLYFDGGTERKLQVKNLVKSACVVHATWTFTVH